MRTYSDVEIIRELQEKNLSLFTLADFSRLFAIENKQTLYKKIQRLEKRKIIKRLIKGKYLCLFQKPSQFTIANFIVNPSYISLESALSFYNIITGFPYQVTSVTIKKTKTYLVGQKEYLYTQIKPALFWGYEKKENFLIADKEKSLFDYLYLSFKGLRSFDIEEFDLSLINKKKFKSYYKKIKNPMFLKFIKKIQL